MSPVINLVCEGSRRSSFSSTIALALRYRRHGNGRMGSVLVGIFLNRRPKKCVLHNSDQPDLAERPG
ncbi:MAG: hypothetical protein MI923_15385 [Phycisphaerales bacterium]|nr:hypothetical protein [Phycisphaerales bacterium]